MRYALLVLCFPSIAFAQTTISGTTNTVRHERPITVSRAVRTNAPIDLDGRLNEAAWASAPVTDSFTQIDPDEGQGGTQVRLEDHQSQGHHRQGRRGHELSERLRRAGAR